MEILVLAPWPSGILHLLEFYGVSETQNESARVDVREDVARMEKPLNKSLSA
jgi:hypothetical protein